MSAQTKCRYFNVGFCKKKTNCKYLHPTLDCENNCSKSECTSRHRIYCKNGQDCHYYSLDLCEFKHDNGEIVAKITTKEENKNLHKIIKQKETDFNVIVEKLNNALKQIEELEKLEQNKLNIKQSKEIEQINIDIYNRPYICVMCREEYTNQKDLDKHNHDSHDNLCYKCYICSHTEHDYNEYIKHINEIHEGAQIKCKECDYEGFNDVNIEVHMHTFHVYSKMLEIVKKYTKEEKNNIMQIIQQYIHEGYTTHKLINKKNSYKCILCNVNINDNNVMLLHMNIHHNQQQS